MCVYLCMHNGIGFSPCNNRNVAGRLVKLKNSLRTQKHCVWSEVTFVKLLLPVLHCIYGICQSASLRLWSLCLGISDSQIWDHSFLLERVFC